MKKLSIFLMAVFACSFTATSHINSVTDISEGCIAIEEQLALAEDCSASIDILQSGPCGLVVATLFTSSPGTSYAWSVSPSIPFVDNGFFISLYPPTPIFPGPSPTYTVSVTITG